MRTRALALLLAVFVLHLDRLSAQYTVGVASVTVNGALVTLSVNGPSGDTLLPGNLGLTLPSDVTTTDCTSQEGGACIAFSNGWTLNVEEHATIPGCSRILWQTNDLTDQLQDCFTVDNGTHMYGGGESAQQHWAIEEYDRALTAVVSQDNTVNFGGLVERYWLFSSGALINADWDVPLWFELTASTRTFCFSSVNQAPYYLTEEYVSGIELKYTVCSADNVKDAHLLWIEGNDIRPDGVSDERMVVSPVWSTWAPYKSDINADVVLQFAQDITSYNFPISQMEIDDRWETCYGEQVFDTTRFPDIASLVDTLHGMDMHVTLWIHPFINNNCPSFQTVADNSYLVNLLNGSVGPVTWWDSSTDQAGVFDFTNEEASTWWLNRLSALQNMSGMDSFKFDAGETYWLPAGYALNSNINVTYWPIAFTENYVRTVSNFGNMVEVRSGSQTYGYNIFRRMIDKDSLWTYDNGLQTMIPSTLFSGIVGYVHVLPDMVGGNAYSGEYPDSELFLRWLQVNVFLPSVQLSITPWSYDNVTADIARDMLSIRTSYSDYIVQLFQEAASNGYPIVRPLWWISPTDTNTLSIDSEYLLGDDLLVAPILEEGATSRDIYFPEGVWFDAINGVNITGPQTVTGYSAAINQLPYFPSATNAQLMQIAVANFEASKSKPAIVDFQKIKPNFQNILINNPVAPQFPGSDSINSKFAAYAGRH